MHPQRPLETLSDDDLLRRLDDLLQQSRRVESDLVAHIAEVDERRLFAHEAFPSMFAYSTEALHLSEAEAYLRIAAARASREHPILLTMLADGRLHLTGLAKLAPYLTPENRDSLLARASHRTKRQIEELIAEIAPRPDVPALMRQLPERCASPVPALAPPPRPDPESRPLGEPRPDGVASPPHGPAITVAPPRPWTVPSPPPSAVVQPLAPGRYRVQFTASAKLHEKLERLQALMGVPGGDLAVIFDQLVTEKLERLEARRFATTQAPRKGLSGTDASPSSRQVPAAVRRAVYKRDGNRCCYVDEHGRRCSERRRLEFHHRHPFGLGGDHGLTNVCLMCRGHNAYLAEQDYGRAAMARHRRAGNRASGQAARAAPRVSTGP